MRLLYAAYGSNLHPERLGRRVPSARLVGTSTVQGWALRFDKAGKDGSGKCNIVPSDSRVQIAVYEIDAAERATLDRIEGLNFGYRAISFDIAGFGECFAYRASETHIDDGLAPFSWYKELVLVGCELHAFEQDYVDAIRAVRDVRDHDASRHKEHMEIVWAAASRTSQPQAS